MPNDNFSKFLNKVIKKRNNKKLNKTKLVIDQTVLNASKSSYNHEKHLLQNESELRRKSMNNVENSAQENKNRTILQAKRKSCSNVRAPDSTQQRLQNEESESKHRHSFGCASYTESKAVKRKFDEPIIGLSKHCKFGRTQNVQKCTKNLAAKRMAELRRSLDIQKKMNEKDELAKNKSTHIHKTSTEDICFNIPKRAVSNNSLSIADDENKGKLISTVVEYSNKEMLKRKSSESVTDSIKNLYEDSSMHKAKKKIMGQHDDSSIFEISSINSDESKLLNTGTQSTYSFTVKDKSNVNLLEDVVKSSSVMTKNFNHSIFLSSNQSLNSESPRSTTFINTIGSSSLSAENSKVENSKFDITCNNMDIEMDWEAIPKQQILEDIQEIRKNIGNTNFSTFVNQKEILNIEDSFLKNNLYIIVDTNIFISHINIVKQIIESDFKRKHTVIVPWMVLQELDYMKDNRSNMTNKLLKNNARHAVQFLNNCFTSKNSRIKGQTALDASTERFKETIPDDGILNCCMQFCSDDNFVVLLSNDKNLRNKALVNNIASYGTDDVLLKLVEESYTINENSNINDKSNNFFTLVQQMQSVLCKYFSIILEYEMKKVYEDLWLKIVFKKPPWTIDDVLQCFIKHWIAVFGLVFPKETKQTIEKLLKELTNINLETQSFDTIVQLSISVCIHLRRVNGYHKIITDCINEIKNLDCT